MQICEEYLEAVCKRVPVTAVQQLKICPHCWTPKSEAETMWLHPQAKHWFACGEVLRDRSVRCNETIMSLKFRLCPYCGTTYKSTK